LDFTLRCEKLFSETLGYGKRWKSIGAIKLGIDRKTLYSYLKKNNAPSNILARLEKLENNSSTPKSTPKVPTQDLVRLMAASLQDVEEQLSSRGWIAVPYHENLQRLFDLSAARNIDSGSAVYPTDLPSLIKYGSTPLFEWLDDVSWDKEGEFLAETLLQEGQTTHACNLLAAHGADPETELRQNKGFQALYSFCVGQKDGQQIYADFRRLTVESPLLTNISTEILTHPRLCAIAGNKELLNLFYEPLPDYYVYDRKVHLCKVTNIPMRIAHSVDGLRFQTESRDPDAIRLARSGQSYAIPHHKDMRLLNRAFRLYWTLPGQAELELFNSLIAAGWTCELWPKLDVVDIQAVAPGQRFRLIIDVKDYLSPTALAASFNGFGESFKRFQKIIVIPDYLKHYHSNYEQLFSRSRETLGKRKIDIMTVSAFVKKFIGENHETI
jgi:hypothetical protein